MLLFASSNTGKSRGICVGGGGGGGLCGRWLVQTLARPTFMVFSEEKVAVFVKSPANGVVVSLEGRGCYGPTVIGAMRCCGDPARIGESKYIK